MNTATCVGPQFWNFLVFIFWDRSFLFPFSIWKSLLQKTNNCVLALAVQFSFVRPNHRTKSSFVCKVIALFCALSHYRVRRAVRTNERTVLLLALGSINPFLAI